MLAILRHDGTCSVVSVNGYSDNGGVWVTFGEVTPDGFSPCYASLTVPASDLRTVTGQRVSIPVR